LQPTTYLLYVGTLQPRKNILTLIDAFHKLWKQIQTYKLVIVGKKGWLYEEIFTKVQELNLQEQVVFTDYLPDDQLVALYKNAFCFILPSLYEGFGIPVLEAMSFSCPVITSFASSLPEIGGDACLYFDPHSSDDLVEKIQRLRDDTALRKDLIKKGRERIKQFSWEKCADETLNVIQQAVNM
ncbi:glycosyltransferase family 4 protein, partial [Candidatus Roizmanbacteria bacterium]|nr:glycosyltransferase family 4 protein [Candidatus Roizmanbacteria bacterium]